MTKQELYAQMRRKGYTEGFLADLDDDPTGTVAKLIRQIEAGKDAAAWADVERLHDKYTYFTIYDDEYIIASERG